MLADKLGHEKVSTTLNTYSHLFPHKQQELVHSLESLQATDSPTPEPPSDNPLLEAAGITCEVPQTQSNGSDVTIRPQFGPALVPSNTASGEIIQMPQRKII
jgi:site-specific recombinase xerD